MGQIVEAACKCGQQVLIEHDSKSTNRRDGKRVFYSDIDPPGLCAFRCRSCHEPVNETVPGADYAPIH